MQMKNQIMSLLSSENLSAPDVTRPLKCIGDGNMLDGLKNMCSFSYNEGIKKGTLVGGFTVSCVFGGVYLVYRGVKIAQSEFTNIKKNKELSKKIQNAFEENLSDAETQIMDEEGIKEAQI